MKITASDDNTSEAVILMVRKGCELPGPLFGIYRSLVSTSCSFCSDINIGDEAVKWYLGPKLDNLAVSVLIPPAKTPAESESKTGQPGR